MLLDELTAQVVENGADGESFKAIIAKLEALSPGDAIIVLLKALSKNPDLILVRLELSKLLWKLDCSPFALKQLQEIEKVLGSSNDALNKLIQRLGGVPSIATAPAESGEQKTLASMDFDIEVLDEGK